jgi:hypothetical protein
VSGGSKRNAKAIQSLWLLTRTGAYLEAKLVEKSELVMKQNKSNRMFDLSLMVGNKNRNPFQKKEEKRKTYIILLMVSSAPSEFLRF